MWIKKVNLVVFLVCAFVVGYGACALFGTLSVDGNLLGGDIAKADLYSGQKEDPDVAVVEERLQNDTAFLHQTQGAMALLKQRLDTLNDLTDRTMSLCAGVAEFKGVMPGISSLQVKAHNASLALDRTAEELKKVADGKRSNLYEQASNNAFIGFMKTESQLAIGKKFVETATKYINKNGEKVSESLARLVADWIVYCTEDAMMNGSEDETAYWLSSADKVTDSFAQLINAGELKTQMQSIVGGGPGILGFQMDGAQLVVAATNNRVILQSRGHILVKKASLKLNKNLLRLAMPIQSGGLQVQEKFNSK